MAGNAAHPCQEPLSVFGTDGTAGAYVQFSGGEATPGGLDIAEATLRALTEAGFDETESLRTFATVVHYAESMAKTVS